MIIYKKIREEQIRLQSIEKMLDSKLTSQPSGYLRCATNKGCFQYYNGNKYLGKSRRKEVIELAEKDYYVKLNKKLCKQKKLLEQLMPFYEEHILENVYENMHLARKILVSPVVKPVEMIIEEFENEEYEGKAFREEDYTEYYTIKGERVRSKSEKIIADELYRYGIPYHYEYPIKLSVGSRSIIFYPDFTALNRRNGRRWILEHLRMMDDVSYYEQAMKKLDTYERNGLLLGRDIILSRETSKSPLNTKILDKHIEEYCL